MADPLADYFSHLLSDRGEVSDQHVNWNDLLSDALSPYHLQDALDRCTLAPGFAPVRLQCAGEGNTADQRSQLFQLLHYVAQLSDSRLRRCMLATALPLTEEAARYG